MNNTIAYILFIVIVLSWTLTARSDVSASQRYIEHFLRLYPERKADALQLLPTVEGYSAIHAIDPIITTVVISCESSWHTNKPGPIGEQGLMQVHGECARGYDLSVPEQQIQAGIACLAKARDSCDGSLRQMLTMYQSGSCVARTKRTKLRITRRMRIIEKWREM